jgi:hypothetical protein
MVEHATRQSSWWLESSSGRCAGCEVKTHEELLIYCVTCDRRFCPLCIIAIQRRQELICHGCEVDDPINPAEES